MHAPSHLGSSTHGTHALALAPADACAPPDSQARHIAIWGISPYVGFAAGFALAGLTVAGTGSWRIPFYICGWVGGRAGEGAGGGDWVQEPCG